MESQLMTESHAAEKVCQSCGMPMAAAEHFGTNGDNTPSGDYCCFCFRDGFFTDDMDMEANIANSLSFHDESGPEQGRILTKEEMGLRLRTLLPGLKRWRAHSLHNEYYRAVNRAVDYINSHLAEKLDLETVAREAGISGFHFHRIFSAVLNESPGEYIQRLRLEKGAFLLQGNSLPVAEVAVVAGYGSLSSFSKAFKKYFGITPSAYRRDPVERVPGRETVPLQDLSPQIKPIEDIKVAYLRLNDPFSDPGAFRKAWRSLTEFLGLDAIPDQQNRYFSLNRDVSTLTRPQHFRAYACVSCDKDVKPHGKFGTDIIRGGLYAVFTHKGPHDGLNAVYCNIYRNWIPNSSYELRDMAFFENYLNNPDTTPESELITEIYIPVAKKPLITCRR